MSQRKDDNSEVCKEATDALEIYGKMDACLKAKFLNDFITHGRGKGKESLKFRYTYQRTAIRTKEDKISTTENDLNRHGCSKWLCLYYFTVVRRYISQVPARSLSSYWTLVPSS